MKQNFLKSILLFLAAFHAHAFSEIWGKVDFAPAYVHIDVLNFNRVVRKLDMLAVKGDATIVVKDGFCLKPTIMYAANQGDLLSVGLSIGHCFPIAEKWILTPTVGYSYTYMRTSLKFNCSPFKCFFKERFRSRSPLVGIEITYRILPCLRACGQMQYSWSKTHTRVGEIIDAHDHARGPLFAALLEYDFNEVVSANIGAAYNLSLSKEKHGIRGYGAKAGFAYWF